MLGVVTAYDDDGEIGPWAALTYVAPDVLLQAGRSYVLTPLPSDDGDGDTLRWTVHEQE